MAEQRHCNRNSQELKSWSARRRQRRGWVHWKWCKFFRTSKPTPSDRAPPTRSLLLIFSKQSHQLGTQYSNICMGGVILIQITTSPFSPCPHDCFNPACSACLLESFAIGQARTPDIVSLSGIPTWAKVSLLKHQVFLAFPAPSAHTALAISF